MLSKVLETPVDFLVELVKKNDNCSISFLKNKLNVKEEIIEKWLVILEEYKILEVKYKGFEGFVKFKEKNKSKNNDKNIEIDNLKEKFISSSKKRNLSYFKMGELWPLFILEYENEIKKIFFENAQNKKINKLKIEKAWEKYKSELVVF